MEKSIKHMTTAHSFFIPDLKYVCNLEGLIGYLGESCMRRDKTGNTKRSSYPDYVTGEGHSEEAMEEDKEVTDEQVSTDEQDENNYQLVLPSGSVVGHRSLMRYYRQKLRPDRQLVVKNPSSVSRVMAQYKALGWTGTTGLINGHLII
ncbi:hypothetical protein LSH36_611g03036 [Paralvinella palmiformis]|uniref:ZN622/Rei1/Reh1 zinc finger C2H2-type domain-containing protein n=1 Tax=Paralvinella palmiformis TaxID=53620 RepID=A0AAD9MUY2_9ANNE|nr:hypothetical protein LSH36_611g03036 [Paralvinella palmiformis]